MRGLIVAKEGLKKQISRYAQVVTGLSESNIPFVLTLQIIHRFSSIGAYHTRIIPGAEGIQAGLWDARALHRSTVFVL
jgi:hypothetical protein